MEKFLINGIILVLPIILVRFFLLASLNKDAVIRAAFYPPTIGIEKIAYMVNILTTFLLLGVPFFLKINLHGILGFEGLGLLTMGLVFYIIAIIQFARPNSIGLNTTGLYSISRNPMYVAFFLYFLGCCMVTSSLLLLIILAVFQISVHFLIISEERWCKKKFGETYLEYMVKVRRYI
jgi:protein-S-isoprenylcysteine O-methyltransferase Ste14